jgi:uncharacterized protein YggE
MFRNSMVAAVVVMAGALAQAADAPKRTISTSGTATVYVVPDEATVRFEVHTFNGDLSKAKAENDGKCAEVLKLVKGMGVDDKSIQMAQVRTAPVYERPDEKKPAVLTGYSVGRTYAIKLKDLNKLEKLSDAIMTNPSCSWQGFEYRTTQWRKHQDEARKMAVRAAREKAQAMAGELDCTIGPPVTVTVTDSDSGYWRSGSNHNSSTHDASPNLFSDDAEQLAPLGEIEVRAIVNVTFDLVPEQ